MKISQILLLAFLLPVIHNSLAQAKNEISGIWKGTSICQIKTSPCHDEDVVYYVSKLDSLNRCRIIMNKIVDKKEEQMGTMTFEFDPSSQTLNSTDTIHDAVWKFKVTGNKIEGTLVYKSNLYRVVNVTKAN